MNNEQLWQTVLGELELLISKANFITWFKNTFVVSSHEETIIVATPNSFTKSWLEKKYADQILQALKNITSGEVKKINFVVQATKPQMAKQPIDAITPRVENAAGSSATETNRFGLNKKYGFDNFIVGKGNELASAAAKAVTERPGEAYNPLFIYGGGGFGQNHFFHGSRQTYLRHQP